MPIRWRAAHLLLAIDLIGTALFAAEGATTAVGAHLDLLGILVLGFVTAVGGGIVRDLLIGDTPPSAIRDWRYAATTFATGTLMFLLRPTFIHSSHTSITLLTILDAAGLAFFAVSGTAKAIEFHLHPLLAIMMGAITGVGGGTLRDLLINRIPRVLESDIYAVAAILGSAIMLLGLRLRLHPWLSSALGIVACFALRLLAVQHHWNLPGAALPRP